MIAALFCGLFIIGMLFIFLSAIEKESIYSLVGFSIIFVLSIYVMLPGNLQYETGKNTTATYTYDGSNIASITTTETPNYSNFNDFISHFMGFWLMIISIGGFVFSLTNTKSEFKTQ